MKLAIAPMRAGMLIVGIAVALEGARAETPPVPRSPVITGALFDWNTHERRAQGSDNWPMTWSDDGHQYTSWGDGGGFGGNSDSTCRVSMGIARVDGSANAYTGIDVNGGRNTQSGQCNAATWPDDASGGKSYGMLSVGGVLYAWWGPGSNTWTYTETRLLRSVDKGVTWTASSWNLVETSSSLIMPTILNFGQDYSGARDNFVYHYFIRKESDSSGIHKGGNPATGKIDLARVPVDNLMTHTAYEYFAGLDGSGNPTWTADAGSRKPVFEDPNGVGWNLSVSYNPGLRRYLLIAEHTDTAEGQLGLFDAPEPWGPWSVVLYMESPRFGEGHIETNTFFWNFSNKWLSADGKQFTLVFTGVGDNDSWNSVRGTFTSGQVPSPPTQLQVH